LQKFALEQNVTYRELRNLNPWIKNSKLTVPAGKTYQLDMPCTPGQKYRSLFQHIDNPFLKIGDTLR
jgi:hypothetical protein